MMEKENSLKIYQEPLNSATLRLKKMQQGH